MSMTYSTIAWYTNELSGLDAIQKCYYKNWTFNNNLIYLMIQTINLYKEHNVIVIVIHILEANVFDLLC